MKVWPGWRLVLRLERSAPTRCRFKQQTAAGLTRCIFTSGHPPHGHTCTADLTALPVDSPDLLADRVRIR